MARTHVITQRVVTPAEFDEEGNLVTAEITRCETTSVPFTTEEEAAADAAEAAQLAAVPSSVTPYQARVALSRAGLRDAVEAAVNAAPLDVQDAWHYATSVERASPMIASLGAALGLTSDQIDDLFRQAASVT